MGKSVSKNQKWTKKMSNFQKRKYFMKKGYKFLHSEHYGLSHQKNNAKIVMSKLSIFVLNNLGIFSVSILAEKCLMKKCQKMPLNFFALYVTLNAAKKAITILIY
jgi:hypothetical protein